jgi:hypothetical protein
VSGSVGALIARGAALRALLLVVLALSMGFSSAGRFGFRANNQQCPTAPVQTMAIMKLAPDGTWVTEMRAPHPGEKDFVVCHCQAKRAAATQAGWVVPTFVPIVAAEPATIDIPLFASGWDQPQESIGEFDPPPSRITHPPSA